MCDLYLLRLEAAGADHLVARLGFLRGQPADLKLIWTLNHCSLKVLGFRIGQVEAVPTALERSEVAPAT